ncbi:MAG: hypothetical protein ACRDZ4_01095, partial [Egibacteraceae bacterium]
RIPGDCANPRDTFWDRIPVMWRPTRRANVRRLTPAADPRLAGAGLNLLLDQAACVADERNPIGRLAGRVPELVATTRELRQPRGVLR